MARKANTPKLAKESVVFINNYPASLCRKHCSGSKSFTTISFRYKDSWASFIVNDNQIKDSTRKDGTLIENCRNICLGDGHNFRSISIQNEDGSYSKEKLSNIDIRIFINQSRENSQAA